MRYIRISTSKLANGMSRIRQAVHNRRSIRRRRAAMLLMCSVMMMNVPAVYAQAEAPSHILMSTYSYDPAARKLTLNWNKVACTGYVVYASYDDKWVKIATIQGSDNTSYTIDYAIEGYDPFFTDYGWMAPDAMSETDRAILSQGGTYGYRYAVSPYTEMPGGQEVTVAPTDTGDAYYDIDVLKKEAGSDTLKMIDRVLAANATGYRGNAYYTYMTYRDDTGSFYSIPYLRYLSPADQKAIEKFAAENFKEGWTDTEKLIYTVNWINKNVTYDYKYEAKGNGYADNIFTYRLGQCDSYNGAVAELLVYLGYQNVILQCMTPSARDMQHYRAAIYCGDKYYSIEAGNNGKSPGWYWYMEEGLECSLGEIRYGQEQINDNGGSTV